MSTPFKPSPQQAHFFRWVKAGSGSALLEAVAGAGKTTTLIQALGMMRGSVFFGAYNRKIADEINSKALAAGLGGHDDLSISISTMHSAAYSAWRKVYPRCNIDERKVFKLVTDMAADDMGDLGMLAHRAFIQRMCSLGKQFLMGIARKAGNLCVWRKLVAHFSADDELPEGTDLDSVLAMVIKVYNKSAAMCPQCIDFDDMIFAPLLYKVRFPKYDWVLVDECQDLNGARRELALRLRKPGGRCVFVGDSCQAIYGFTGAGSDSIAKIVETFECRRLPLTTTYRCPKAVVNYVHQWVSHIQAHDTAPEGVVRGYSPVSGDARPWYLQDQPGAADAVLCRYSRPLVQAAYGMLREGIACKIEGRDVGKNLIKLARRWKISTLEALDKKLDAYLAVELAKALAADSETRAADAEDRVATLRIFMERCRVRGAHRIDDLVSEIENLFADDVKGVLTLSTGHKSKGREWPRVYWLQAALKARRPLQAWEADQERNLNYVIGTRAMSELVLIPEAPAA